MQVRIYKPTQSAMQSGKGSDKWIFEFIAKKTSKFKEPVMDRTSSTDMSDEVRLSFASLDQAVVFAKKNCYSYEIIEPKAAKLIKKSYANNFN